MQIRIVAGQAIKMSTAPNEMILVSPGTPPTAATLGPAITAAAAKAAPVDADLFGLVDSAAGGVLKKLTWANFKSTVKTFFDTLYDANNISDANATALTDGGETALHSHAGGGGGGGLWEPVESRVMDNTSANEIFILEDTDNQVFLFDNMEVGQGIKMALSLDNGASYPATHDTLVRYISEWWSTYKQSNWLALAYGYLITQAAGGGRVTGRVEISGIADSDSTRFKGYTNYDQNGTQFEENISGALMTDGVATTVKFMSTSGLFKSGKIHHLKRTV